MNFFRDLNRQFARRAEDQHLHSLLVRVHFFHRWDAERGGLAGAGHGLADDVLARHQHGDGGGLDGRGLFVAEFVDGLEQFRRKPEFGKKFWRH